MQKVAAQYPHAKLIQSTVRTKDWVDKMSKVFSEEEAINILKAFNIGDESVLFIASGPRDHARNLLGRIRLEYVQMLEEKFQIAIRKNGLHFLWILDFPLFELNNESGMLQSAHHPFTAPHLDDLSLLDENPLKVRAQAYDLVLNGSEVGGGSVRIHNPVLQERVLQLLDIKKDTLQHIIDMLGKSVVFMWFIYSSKLIVSIINFN